MFTLTNNKKPIFFRRLLYSVASTFCWISSRAAQKLNLSSKRKKHQPLPLHPQEPSIYPTNFSGILQVSPPPAPPCLLRAVSKVKENPGMGKVSAGTLQNTRTDAAEFRGYSCKLELRSSINLIPTGTNSLWSWNTHTHWSVQCRFSQMSLL